MIEVKINTDIIKLDAFLKWSGSISTGSDAKYFIQNEMVKVNGEIETRRGKKLTKGDRIEVDGEEFIIV